MRKKTHFIVCLLIALMPLNYLRILFYRVVLKYQIGNNVKIGHSIINANNVIIGDNAFIGHLNIINKPDLFQMGKSTHISNLNKIISDPHLTFSPKFIIGDFAAITSNHFFDLTDDIIIGNKSLIAGWHSQLWTHSMDIYRNRLQSPIYIGNNVVISSNCLLNLGIVIGNNIIIGMGSVVANNLVEEGCLYVGNPAKKIRVGVTFSELSHVHKFYQYNENVSLYRK